MEKMLEELKTDNVQLEKTSKKLKKKINRVEKDTVSIKIENCKLRNKLQLVKHMRHRKIIVLRPVRKTSSSVKDIFGISHPTIQKMKISRSYTSLL